MKILGIESSCDDTSVSLIEASETGFVVLAEKTASQIDIHKKYGGVIPEVAARAHAEFILPLIEEVMQGQEKPDVIAVTAGPGLMTALLVGVEAARTLSYLWDVPLVRVNHIEGHMLSVLIQSLPLQGGAGGGLSTHKTDNLKVETVRGPHLTSPYRGGNPTIQFPALALVVSGGHTELMLIKSFGEYEKIGKTMDDASGECFDKVAKLLGLEYPGGPKISKLALEGNARAIQFPRPMIHENTFNFSFAGLKTAALYWLRDNQLSAVRINSINLPAGIFGVTPEPPTLSDFCASFEQAITDVLVTKTMKAAKQYNPKTILLGGGVSANKKLRETLEKEIKLQSPETQFLVPEFKYAMDNATMIAVAGYFKAKENDFTSWKDLKADPQWELGE